MEYHLLRKKINIDHTSNAGRIDDHELSYYKNCYMFNVQAVLMSKGCIETLY